MEEEQHGEKRAEYGTRLLDVLAEELSKEYATGYLARDLRFYRQFYQNFNGLEILYACVPNTSPSWWQIEKSKHVWKLNMCDVAQILSSKGHDYSKKCNSALHFCQLHSKTMLDGRWFYLIHLPSFRFFLSGGRYLYSIKRNEDTKMCESVKGWTRSAMRSHRMPLGGIKAMHASALPKTSTALACVGDPIKWKTSTGGGRFQGTRRCLCEKGTKRKGRAVCLNTI